jgi:hypothetical protein
MAGPLACHSQRSWPVPSGQPRTVPQRPQPAPFPSLAGDDRARSGFASRGRGVVPPPTSSPCALDVSRQAGQVVGGRPPWPRGVCVGPAGCWPRCRQNAGGDPGPQALARQAAAPAMPRAGRWLGRACRPGGSGSNRRGLETEGRPWRPSWVAVRAGGQADAEVGEDVDAPACAAVPSVSYRAGSTCG